jgi:hypothetical protein
MKQLYFRVFISVPLTALMLVAELRFSVVAGRPTDLLVQVSKDGELLLASPFSE